MDVLSPHVLPQCFSGLLLRKICYTRLLQCCVFHIEAASVDIRLLPFCSPVFVLFLTKTEFCLSYYEMEVKISELL